MKCEVCNVEKPLSDLSDDRLEFCDDCFNEYREQEENYWGLKKGGKMSYLKLKKAIKKGVDFNKIKLTAEEWNLIQYIQNQKNFGNVPPIEIIFEAIDDKQHELRIEISKFSKSLIKWKSLEASLKKQIQEESDE